jgi:predicted DNA-binding transcriptional regulator AlpA
MNIDGVAMGAKWRVKDIVEYTGTSESSVYRWLRNKDLPAPIDSSTRPYEWEPRVIRKWADEWFRARQPDPDVTGQVWWDAEDIARYLGVEPVSVQRYRSRRELPEPARYFGRFPVWEPKAIIEWDKQRPGHSYKARGIPAGAQDGKKPAARKAVKAARPKKVAKAADAAVPAAGAGSGEVVWWGYAEIAAYLGKSEDAMRHYKHKMPKPERHIGRSPVWPRDVLVKWWSEENSAELGATRRTR